MAPQRRACVTDDYPLFVGRFLKWNDITILKDSSYKDGDTSDRDGWYCDQVTRPIMRAPPFSTVRRLTFFQFKFKKLGHRDSKLKSIKISLNFSFPCRKKTNNDNNQKDRKESVQVKVYSIPTDRKLSFHHWQ